MFYYKQLPNGSNSNLAQQTTPKRGKVYPTTYPEKEKPLQSIDLQGFLLFGCGGGGIRTPGPVTVNGFQDRRIKPLCHPSGFAAAKIRFATKLQSHFEKNKFPTDKKDLARHKHPPPTGPPHALHRPLPTSYRIPDHLTLTAPRRGHRPPPTATASRASSPFSHPATN